jgi:hypothetical protein
MRHEISGTIHPGVAVEIDGTLESTLGMFVVEPRTELTCHAATDGPTDTICVHKGRIHCHDALD